MIVADFHEPNLDRCTAIAVALMRHVAKSDCMACAAIAEGEFADISGLWPREIREAARRDGAYDVIRLGGRLMTMLPVMGTALINANKLDHCGPLKGSILTISTKNAARVPNSFPRQLVASKMDITVIDRIHAESPLLDDILANSGIRSSSVTDVEKAVRTYLTASPQPPKPWIKNTSISNGLILNTHDDR